MLARPDFRITTGQFNFQRVDKLQTADNFWYRGWFLDYKNGLFSIYSRAESISLDYPPLFLILFYPVYLLYNIIPPDAYHASDMLFLKIIPILFDTATCLLAFSFARKKLSDEWGLIGAGLWALCPAIYANNVLWGQTDSILIFLLLAVVILLQSKKYFWATVVFTASCMIKFQALFIATIYLLGIIKDTGTGNGAVIRRLFICLTIALSEVLIVFIPFMIGFQLTLKWQNMK